MGFFAFLKFNLICPRVWNDKFSSLAISLLMLFAITFTLSCSNTGLEIKNENGSKLSKIDQTRVNCAQKLIQDQIPVRQNLEELFDQVDFENYRCLFADFYEYPNIQSAKKASPVNAPLVDSIQQEIISIIKRWPQEIQELILQNLVAIEIVVGLESYAGIDQFDDHKFVWILGLDKQIQTRVDRFKEHLTKIVQPGLLKEMKLQLVSINPRANSQSQSKFSTKTAMSTIPSSYLDTAESYLEVLLLHEVAHIASIQNKYHKPWNDIFTWIEQGTSPDTAQANLQITANLKAFQPQYPKLRNLRYQKEDKRLNPAQTLEFLESVKPSDYSPYAYTNIFEYAAEVQFCEWMRQMQKPTWELHVEYEQEIYTLNECPRR